MAAMTEPLLRMTGISKRFPGVLALDDVDFEVAPGEIHALLGENGAGKSTLLKILSGAQQPDAGTISFGGADGHAWRRRTTRSASASSRSTRSSRSRPNMTIAENVFIGREPGPRLFVNWRQDGRRDPRAHAPDRPRPQAR